MSIRASHSFGAPLNSIPKLATDKPEKPMNTVTISYMDPQNIETYLIEKYGIQKLRDSNKKSEKFYVDRNDEA